MAEIPEIGDLRPLSTGELIDRGFTLYRQNFAGLFLLALLAQIAPLVTSLVMTRSMNLAPGAGGFTGQPMVDLPHLGVLLGVSFVGQIISFLFAVAMTTYLSDAYLMGGPSMKASFGRLREMFGSALVTALLNIFLITLSMLFPIVAILAVVIYTRFRPPTDLMSLIVLIGGAGVLLVAAIAPVLIVFVRLMLTAPAVALERLSGWQAAKRSSALVRFDPGLGFLYWGEMRLSILLLPLVAIELLSMTLTSLPVTIYAFFRHGPVGQMATAPESAQVLTQILTMLAASLLLPLYLIAVTLFYFDVRVRREGYDLERMAERLKGANAS